MSRQKITIIPNENTKQDETLIKKLEDQYNQQVEKCKRLRRDCLEKNRDKSAVASSSSVFLEEVQNALNATICTQNALRLINKPIPNNLLLLKIKFMIMLVRIYTITSDLFPERIVNALKNFTELMQEITKHAKTLNVKNNSIQKEMAYALRVISIYGDAGDLENYDSSQWVSVQWWLMRQYKNNFDKLESYKANCDFTGNKKSIFAVGKSDVYSVYEAMDKEYSVLFTKNELTIEEKLDYLKATYLVYETTIKNHPTIKKTTFTHYVGTKAHSITPLANFFNILQKEYEKHIPKIDSLRRAMDIDGLMEDLNALSNLRFHMPYFYKFIQDQINDLQVIHKYLSHTNETILKDNVFYCIVTMRRFFIDFHTLNCRLNDRIQEELTGFDFFKSKVGDESENYSEGKSLNEDCLTNFKTLYLVSKEKSQNIQNSAIQISNDTIDELISIKPNTKHKANKKSNNHNKLIITQTVAPPKEKIIKKEIVSPISKSKRFLEQGNLMISNKNYEKAIRSFEEANRVASNLEDKLYALDRLISSVQQEVSQSLTQINPEYDFSVHKIKESEQILLTGEKNALYLDTLYKEFNHTLENTNLKERQTEIAYGNAILRDDYFKIKDKISHLNLIKDTQLAQKNKSNGPKNKIVKNASKITPTTIIQAHYPLLPLVTPVETESPYIQKNREVTLPLGLKEVFDFLNKVQGDHYLVGSMVLQLLQEEQEQNKIQPSDLDCLSLHSKSEDWIKNGHFMQITEEKHLFKLTTWCEFKPILPLEVWLEDEKKDLIECLLARDFTVAALACTAEGHIIDPTGLGFDDLKKRRLRMIGNSETRFQQSPSILLRVIKYIMLGFTPDDSILDAMHAWQPTEETNRSQLQALCGKIFCASDKLVFVQLLKQYQLLYKLYELPSEATCEEVVLFLEKHSNKTSKNKNSFFLTYKIPLNESQKTEEESSCSFK